MNRFVIFYSEGGQPFMQKRKSVPTMGFQVFIQDRYISRDEIISVSCFSILWGLWIDRNKRNFLYERTGDRNLKFQVLCFYPKVIWLQSYSRQLKSMVWPFGIVENWILILLVLISSYNEL